MNGIIEYGSNNTFDKIDQFEKQNFLSNKSITAENINCRNNTTKSDYSKSKITLKINKVKRIKKDNNF